MISRIGYVYNVTSAPVKNTEPTWHPAERRQAYASSFYLQQISKVVPWLKRLGHPLNSSPHQVIECNGTGVMGFLRLNGGS